MATGAFSVSKLFVPNETGLDTKSWPTGKRIETLPTRSNAKRLESNDDFYRRQYVYLFT